MRFERGCANPVWWCDYTRQERGKRGSAITHTRTPAVEVRRSGWQHSPKGWTIDLAMRTATSFRDYAIALWDLPSDFSGDPRGIETNAAETIIAWNDKGELHLVLVFDLKPGARIRVVVRNPS